MLRSAGAVLAGIITAVVVITLYQNKYYAPVLQITAIT